MKAKEKKGVFQGKWMLFWKFELLHFYLLMWLLKIKPMFPRVSSVHSFIHANSCPFEGQCTHIHIYLLESFSVSDIHNSS
jgi:hypothetical protein